MSAASLFGGGAPQYNFGAPAPAASESPMVYTAATRTVAPNVTAGWGSSDQQNIAFNEDGGSGTTIPPVTLTTTRVRLANGTYATTASCPSFILSGCTGGGNSFSSPLTQFFESENVVAGSALVFMGGSFELSTVQLDSGVLKVVTVNPLAPGDHVVFGFSFRYISL